MLFLSDQFRFILIFLHPLRGRQTSAEKFFDGQGFDEGRAFFPEVPLSGNGRISLPMKHSTKWLTIAICAPTFIRMVE
ncbi:hypothetical protein LP421_31750 (plasmid) [Rhizobium sp. RCAM05350]|nr:hypothetical protein LP421_31750 [Rhizobium sp. RCAM05350]